MLSLFNQHVLNFLKKDEGQGMVEYALLIGLIAIGVIAALVVLGPTIAAKFDEITNAL